MQSVADETLGSADNPILTLAAGGSGTVAVEGAIDTLVLSSNSKSYISGKKENGISATGTVTLEADGNTTLYVAAGSAAGSGVAGVGATVNTIVVNKTIEAEINSSLINANKVDILANANDIFRTYALAGSASGTAAVSGAISTNVINSTVRAGITGGTILADEINILANAKASFQDVTGAAAGGGVAGVGASVVTNVIAYNAESYIDNSTISDFTKIDVEARTNEEYDFYAISGAAGGTTGASGVVSTNIINNNVKSYVTGNITEKDNTESSLSVKSSDTITYSVLAGTLSASAGAGVGATIQTNSVSSIISSYIGGTIKADDIDVSAYGKQTFNDLMVMGFAGGSVGVSGSALALILDNNIQAYTLESSTITSNSLNIIAENEANIDETVGTGAIGEYAAVGASVAVNQISNTVSAYTGKSNILNVDGDINVSAKSTNNIGSESDNINIVAGSAGAVAGVAGAVLVNIVEDDVRAYLGSSNTISSDTLTSIDILAQADTNIYETVGGYGIGGLAGVGAAVGINSINSTSIASIGSNTYIYAKNADITLNAISNEIISANGNVVGGGTVALSGGIIVSTIGKTVLNASDNPLSDDDLAVYETAYAQAEEILDTAQTKISDASANLDEYYTKAKNDVFSAVDEANNNINSSLSDGLSLSLTDGETNTYINSDTILSSAISEEIVSPDLNDVSAFTLNTATASTDRQYTTSAFIDSASTIIAKSLAISAKNNDDVDINVNGNTFGAAAIGVSAAISNVYTTTNAFISNNVSITTMNGDVTIGTKSTDNQDVTASAAAGGIISGAGVIAKANSNKTTNSYILSSAKINSAGLFSLAANAGGVINAVATSGSYGGVSIGVSEAVAKAIGTTRIDISENGSISSDDDLIINTVSEMTANADATAGTGGVLSGSGAEAESVAGQDNTVNIGANINLIAANDIQIASNAVNNANAETNARAYGGISAGGTKTTAKISHTGGVNIENASTTGKTIKGNSVSITSLAENTTYASTEAGSGAVVGVSGSGVYNSINSTNTSYVGSGYTIETTGGNYSVAASNVNTYQSYNNSSAYGAVGAVAGIIENTVNSTVNAKSLSDINSAGAIEVAASNTITKSAVSNYDLYGGAGGVAGIGSASLTDTITAETYALLAGDYAYAKGSNGSGYVSVISSTGIDINEKVDVTAAGAIPVADGTTVVSTNSSTTTEIQNKDIKTTDDDIEFLANSSVNLYTKSNVSSYGGVAVADGLSEAVSGSNLASVLIGSGVNSLSGRDTYVQSVINKDIQAYMYAETKGLIGAVGGSEAIAQNVSSSIVNINSGAYLGAYDSMNVSALDSVDNLVAKRSAKGTTYLLFGIPITIYGSGNETTNDSSSASIVLNGSIESGLGANRSLTINEDGTYTAEGITISTEKVGEVSTDSLQDDIELTEEQREAAIASVKEYAETQSTAKSNAQAQYDTAEAQKAEYEAQNETYQAAVDNAETIITYNNTISENTATLNEKTSAYNENAAAISEISKITEAYENAYTAESFDADSFYANCSEIIANYETVNEAYSAYILDDSSENLAALKSAVDSLSSTSDTLSAENLTLTSEISNLKSNISSLNSSVSSLSSSITNLENIDTSNNDELSSFIATYNSYISSNNTSIAKCESTMARAESNMASYNSLIAKAEADIASLNAQYDAIVAEIQAEIDSAEGSSISVYSIYVDDIYVRSAETNITGNVIGSGSITASGNSFTVDIVNNSVSDIVYNDIQIDSNAKGGIYVSGSVADSIKQTVKNTDSNYSISITNTVDANDPTISTANGYGDMILYGDIINVNGDVTLINNTGSLLSEGGITAKNIKMAIPNGGYTQAYTENTLQVGGTDGTGAIVASGDIDISAKVIDINGLIQSGSEYKSVTIPEFTVKYENGVYYQVNSDGTKTAMTAGSTEGYYYINTSGNSSLDSELEEIKAYYNVNDGKIYLFKAEISGGNITLTGNIISTTSNGQIVLVNGYGHIDVVNNSSYELVTSILNADANLSGTLTINDFYFSDYEGTTFDSVTASNINSYIANSSLTGIYTAYVDENGNIVTSSTGKTSGNGSWGSSSYSTDNDGLNTYSTTYTPGNDSYVMVKAGETVEHSYTYYVKRSWWTELWYGKLYKTGYYYTYSEPEYGTAKNAVKVTFQGYDSPSINVTSVGDVTMNANISALMGDVSINSSGNISTNSINNIITAKDIDLTAASSIGDSTRALQVAIYDSTGSLNASAYNVYLNYPNTDVGNITINADNLAYLSTSGSTLGSLDSIVNINADTLELRAASGTIAIDEGDTINVHNIKARANGDISIVNEGDLNVSSIVSTSKGTVTLESKEGSINAADTEQYSPYHINAGNIVIKAVNGAIGANSNPLLIANDGIYNVSAKDDIYISSIGRIYADLISSTEGSINLSADYGIIASNSSDGLLWNIYSTGDVNLTSQYGNIENIAINTDGVINAIAGYTGDIASGLSDISITLISQDEITEADVNMSEEEYKEYYNNAKDMKIGTIKASRNVSLTSERSILNADDDSSITGEQIVLSTNGDIGSEDSAIKLSANRDITAYAGDGSSVYLTSDGDLHINEIRSYINYDSATGETSTAGVLENVVLSAKGSITNASIGVSTTSEDEDGNTVTSTSYDTTNIIAKNITMDATGDIGSLIKYFTVDTTDTSSETGLTYSAVNAYIKGTGDTLNVKSASSVEKTYLTSDSDIMVTSLTTTGDTSITATNNATIAQADIGGSLTANANNFTVTNTLTTTGDTSITADDTITIANASSSSNLTITSAVAEITNMDVAGNADITTTNDTTIASAVIGETLTVNADNLTIANATVEGNTELTTTNDTTIASATVGGNLTSTANNFTVTNTLTTIGDTSITTIVDTVIASAVIGETLTINADNLTITNATVAGNTELTTTNDTTIASATVGGNLTSTANNFTVTDKLTTIGDTSITADDTITIANASISSNLVITSAVAEITNMDVAGNADITTTGDTIIASAIIGETLTVNADNLTITNATVAGNTELTTTNDTTIASATVGGNLTSTANNFTVTDTLTTTGDTSITATNNATIAQADIGGNLTSIANNFTVTDTLTTIGDTSITADDTVTIANASSLSDLTITSETTQIDELDLDGNLYVVSDSLTLNSSNDVNVGVITGNSSTYASNITISVNSLLNGLTSSDTNIYAKTINLAANNSIGTSDSSLNINLAQGNSIISGADNLINISTTGAGANYKSVNTNALMLASDNGVNISGMNVDTLTLSTASNNIDIQNATISTGADIKTANKHIVVDNTSLSSIQGSTIQLYTTKQPISLYIDGSNLVFTQAVNVVGHNQNIYINYSKDDNSMLSHITTVTEANLKNTNVAEKTIEKTDALVYQLPTESSYLAATITDNVWGKLVSTFKGEDVTIDNVSDVINYDTDEE